MARKRRGRAVNGWLCLDKPVGMTSTDAVGKAKRLFDAAKAGHAGTLDPLASGILPIAFGEATKTVAHTQDASKLYRFTIRWGEARDTEDAEGRVTETSPVRPDVTDIDAVLPRFHGELEQVPPIYSAIKVQGERAYDLAREGTTVDLPPRQVRIDALRVVSSPDADHAEFECRSGKGAYMRALARDIALALGTVGHMSALRRLQVGAFSLDASTGWEQLSALAEAGRIDDALLPVETPLDDIPAVALSDAEAHRLRCGQTVALLRRSQRERLEELGKAIGEGGEALMLAKLDGTPVAIVRLSGIELRPVRVLNL